MHFRKVVEQDNDIYVLGYEWRREITLPPKEEPRSLHFRFSQIWVALSIEAWSLAACIRSSMAEMHRTMVSQFLGPRG
jgi:hypothetical protein